MEISQRTAADWFSTLIMNRKQLKTISGLITGHRTVKEHQWKIRNFTDLSCSLFSKKLETAMHIVSKFSNKHYMYNIKACIFVRSLHVMEPDNFKIHSVTYFYLMIQRTPIIY